ncbi:MAG: tRNA lysidine(34) synthetase TilS [Clostridia bacterium]|jgi:tRNA(Ile)-lysidine synthase|nr:tRNA lysidine(34) synthetase TilS [Clostridia bacterium]MCI1999048.1 tRNA lysidine(34) synthetase TilS [Clostridia bacterium]MCI2013798.1 tRNA lysidine(34) synthetase TilS [Clostridia bacterium]
MFHKALDTVKKYNMLSIGDSVVCGVSGGADSTALLLFMCSIREIYKLNIFAIHVHHGIRGKEADDDCQFVEELCKSLDVPLTVKKYAIIEIAKQSGLSEEEAGRKARYYEFEEERKKHENCKIAIAHNMNDQAETVLMRLCRGSGLTGLCGIRPVRGDIIRPLIFCSRSEIEDYLKEKCQDFRNDSTNFMEDYTRNKIRLRILPYIEKNINSAATKNIANAATLLLEDEMYIENAAVRAFEYALLDISEKKVTIDLAKFSEFDRVIQKRIVRKAAWKLKSGIKDVSNVHVEEVLKLSKMIKGHFDLPNGIKADSRYGKLSLSLNENIKESTGYSYELLEDKIIYVKEAGLFFELTRKNKKNESNLNNMYTKSFDYDKISGVAYVRTRKQDDKISINKNGNSKKIKKLFIDCKIPAEKRDSIPLIAFSNEVIWAVGIRCGTYYEASENTKNVCHINIWRLKK